MAYVGIVLHLAKLSNETVNNVFIFKIIHHYTLVFILQFLVSRNPSFYLKIPFQLYIFEIGPFHYLIRGTNSDYIII